MDFKNKKIVPWAFMTFALANLFVYALVHVSYVAENTSVIKAFAYIGSYASRALEFLAIPLLSTVMLVIYSRFGMRKAFSSIMLISSARVFYTLPYYYMAFFYNYGTLEALLIALVATLAVTLITGVATTVSLKLALFIFRRSMKKERSKFAELLPELVKRPSGKNFLDKASLPILVFALLTFFVNLISEIIDTVSFFISYGSDYTAIEIFTMLINYAILFLLLIVSYLISAWAKNVLVKFEREDKSES